ncbi:insulin-like growth factor 2 mRNA-binding protein 1 isoform X2 [Varroa jacobsoni]|uniref:RRM domain-containing protein n=1 Tax=Varroa destructor TaxID=109461 RepID=A0A7M7J193_VARDE|nr:insulin-like growth factor 2 mRNA-binding protein 1 isoform X2 [Varroa destructor]XP_022691740.1 insulin-like growth factor 2 mRNA-binding protein 1 isoform X2 [Varroa jacobsoni]
MGRQQGSCKVLVSRIPKRVDKQDIRSLLSTYGNIQSCDTLEDERNLSNNRQLGQKSECYRVTATYDNPEQAEQAVRNLARRPYAGGILRAEYYSSASFNGHHYSNGHIHTYFNGHDPVHKRHNNVMGGGRGASGLTNGRGGGVGMSNGLGGLAGGLGPGPFGPYGGPSGHGHAPLGPPPPPPKDIPLRMLVPSEMVGAIIGKSGATIKQITQQSRARVDVHRKDAGGIYNQGQVEKVINIYGSVDNCSAACKKILEVMQQEAANPSDSGAAAAAKRSDEPIVLKLLAHNNLVGRVIGRSGAVIKKVMDETSAKVNVSSMADPRERVIIIKGSLDEMSKAQQQITAKMRQCYEHDMQQAASMMGGYGGPPGPLGQGGHGSGGAMGHGGAGGAMGHHHHHHHHHHSLGGGHGTGMGPPPPPPPPPAYPPPFHRPPLPPPPPHAHHGGPGGPAGAGGHGLPHYGPPYGPMGVPAPGGHFYPPGDGSVETVQVWVPSCTVGAIIGTGGSSIREMIRVSGCSIKVSPSSAKEENRSKDDAAKKDGSKDDTPSSSGAEPAGRREGGVGGVGIYPHPSDRRVTLTGSAEAQWRAQCLLYRKVFLEAAQHLDSNPEAAADPQVQAGHLRVEMNVPSNQVGRIIGKGGQTVKELQRLTHALIKLPEESSRGGQSSSPEPDDETPVHIIGDFYAVQAAQRQIRALVARNANTSGPSGTSTANNNAALKKKDDAAVTTAVATAAKTAAGTTVATPTATTTPVTTTQKVDVRTMTTTTSTTNSSISKQWTTAMIHLLFVLLLFIIMIV